MLVADRVGAVDHLHGAVRSHDDLALADEVVQDVAGCLVGGRMCLSTCELFLELLDLLLLLDFDCLGEILDRQLLLHVGLGAAPLATRLEEVGAAAVGRYMRR